MPTSPSFSRRPHRPLFALAIALACLGQPGALAAAAAPLAPHAPVGAGALANLIGRNDQAVRQSLGAPERITPYETIYTLPNQESLRWHLYQRRGLLVAEDHAGTVRALLYLPNFHGTLAGGLKAGMTQAQVVQRLGLPDHQILGDANSTRAIYLKAGLDLTFNAATERLEQALYYPAIARIAAADAPAFGEPAAAPSATASPAPKPHPWIKPSAKPPVKPSLKPALKPSASASGNANPRPTPHPTAFATSKPTPKPGYHATPRATPTLKPTPKPTAKPTPKPTAKPTPKPTARPTSRPTPKPTPTPRPTPVTHRPAPVAHRHVPTGPAIPLPIYERRPRPTGSASLFGLVSMFNSESGELKYLPGVRLYLLSRPMDETLADLTLKVPGSKGLVYRQRYQARLMALSHQGDVLAIGATDSFGRFALQHLPEGRYTFVALNTTDGHYDVWQQSITLAPGRQTRIYLNRNNLALQSQVGSY